MPLPQGLSGGEKDASKILRSSRSSAENPKEVALSVALYEAALWPNSHKWMQYAWNWKNPRCCGVHAVIGYCYCYCYLLGSGEDARGRGISRLAPVLEKVKNSWSQ